MSSDITANKTEKKEKKTFKKFVRSLKNASIASKMIMVTICFMVAFFIIVLRLAYISVIQHDYYSAKASSQQLRDTTIPASRGTIYDANMNVLARSATVWTVAVTPNSIKSENIDKIATLLSDELGVDYDTVVSKCKESSYYSIVKRKVDQPVVDEIQDWISENGISGITFTEDTKRYYPYGNFAAQLLGFVGTDNTGLYGLESYYDDTLSGIDGRKLTAVNAVGEDMYYESETTTEAQDGYSLVLTIDANIQQILEDALENAIEEHNVSNYAAGIVMNVKTGAVYAMATLPDYDPNDPLEISDEDTLLELQTIEEEGDESAYLDALSEAQTNQWDNKAITDIYEPGSVFKVVTASAALETGTESLESSYYCPGYYNVIDDINIKCARTSGHGQETFTEAVVNSCNPAFIQMGLDLGEDQFYSFFKGYGLTEKTGIDLPAEANSVYYTPDTMGIVELASCSFGQSNAITPIQMITAFAACVNGGYLVQPYVVDQVLDSEGNVISTTETVTKRQVISSETSEKMRLVLEQVVENGNAQVAGYRIGGKSGTAEKLGKDDTYVASFCAFAPVDDPEVICLILLDGANSYSIYGGVIVAPVVASVMAQVLPYLGIEAVYEEDQDGVVDVYVPSILGYNLTSAYASLQKRGLSYEVVGSGSSVVNTFPATGTALANGSTVYLYTEEMDMLTTTVPDVTGHNASYVSALFQSLGLNLKISGSSSSSAEAVSQTIEAGTEVNQGTLITVEFVDPSVHD